MSGLLDFVAQDDVRLVVALVVWMGSYLWLDRIGIDCLSRALEAIVALIPPLAFLAILGVGGAELINNGPTRVFWIFVGAELLVAYLFATGKFESTTEIGGFMRAVREFFVALVAALAAVTGAVSGYQLMFGMQGWGWFLALAAVLIALLAYRLDVGKICVEKKAELERPVP